MFSALSLEFSLAKYNEILNMYIFQKIQYSKAYQFLRVQSNSVVYYENDQYVIHVLKFF